MAKPGGTPKPLEIEIQAAFRKRLYYVAPRVKVVAIPNAGRRTQWEIRQAKKEGLATGFPDVMAVWPGAGVAFIEFKRPGGVTSDNQNEWHQRLTVMGHRVCVAFSVDQAVEFLRQCGAPVMESIGLSSVRSAAQPSTANERTV
jgi:hypothetical protein